MRKLAKILLIGLVLLAGVATTATLTLSDSSKDVVQMACITCGNDVDDGGG